MAGLKSLVTLAFAGSIGITLVILACALPRYDLWWPFFVVLFYVLAPLPTLIARHMVDSSGTTSCMDSTIFITMGIVISTFALPIVLARAPSGTDSTVIQWGACCLTLAGNVVVYLTMLFFFWTLDHDDSEYNMW